MNKIVLYLLLSIYTFAIDTEFWNFSTKVELKKDQLYSLSIDDAEIKKRLFFRWTLFHNNGLVLLLNYDGHPHQYILYDSYRKDTIRLKIARKIGHTDNVPFLLLVFKEFDFENRKAKFDILVKDSSNKLLIKEE